jgi:hypothetical protein
MSTSPLGRALPLAVLLCFAAAAALASHPDPDADGGVDDTPPGLLITLNDIPDDENDLLVAPPDRFRITLHFDPDTGSPIDPSSLRISASEPIGELPAGSDLAPHFSVTPARAVWEVPEGSDLARTAHFLTASIRDLAGNETTDTYGFAVRDFGFGAPLGNLQVVFLDFDRQGDGQQDFKASLRELGLSSPLDPELEQRIVDQLQIEIVGRVHGMYGRDPYGAPGPDPVHILFTWFDPQMPHSSLCIGGENPTTPAALGATPLDLDNILESEDLCAFYDFGVFPHAIDDVWGEDPLFQRIFWPLLTSRGGTPIGEDPLDARLLDAGFDPRAATPAQRTRHALLKDALDAFAQVVAVGAAHEVGHTLGLSAPGPAPGGLFGGTREDDFQHDVTASGELPRENFLMNPGGTFSFAEITGREGYAPPFFRPISWAYLTNRIVRNEQITSLDPAPRLFELTPNPVRYGDSRTASITLHGEYLSNVQLVDLKGTGRLPVPLLDWSVVDDRTLTGQIHLLFTPPGLYDVRVTTDDQQSDQLTAGLQVIR